MYSKAPLLGKGGSDYCILLYTIVHYVLYCMCGIYSRVMLSHFTRFYYAVKYFLSFCLIRLFLKLYYEFFE